MARTVRRPILFVLPIVAALLFAVAAPIAAQEKAKLVNPRKKEKKDEPTEEVAPAAEPAPAEPAPADPAPAPAPAPSEPKTVEAEPQTAAPAPAPAEAQYEREVAEPTAPAPPTQAAEPAPAPAEATYTAPEPEAAAAPPAVAAREPEPAPDRRTAPKPAEDVISANITVTEVLLDVLVTDKQGNVVTGLGPDDFVVEEEGDDRDVTGAVFYGTPEELQSPGVSGETRSDRYFILLFHDQKQILPELTAAQMDANRWVQKWIEEELLPNDQVAVLGYQAKLNVYLDFTRDKQAIIEAVDKAALGRKAPDFYKTRSMPELDPDSPSLLLNLPTGKALSKETRKIQQAMGLIGRAAEGIVGRKNMILFSVGYGDIFFQDFPEWTPDPRYYPDMKQSLNAGNVAVYSIDLLGSVRGGIGGARVNDSLSSISVDTGGHYYYTFVNALTPLTQVTEDNLGYYLLSYKAEYRTGDSGYREIKVKTKDKSYNVRARRGYRYGMGGS